MLTVCITGAQNGIGKAIAEKLKTENYIVLTPSRKELDVKFNSMILYYFKNNKIDILINNAGYIHPNKIVDLEYGDLMDHFAVNIVGAFLCSKYAILNGCNTVVNIGSTSAFEGRPEWGAYCASKAGLLSLTETLVKEGYTSYTINPSRTDTKMREMLFPGEDKNKLMPPERIANIVCECLKGCAPNGSHLVIYPNNVIEKPMRTI